MLVESNTNPAHGEIGEIFVTFLNLSPMPFIRYRVGDIGRVVHSNCACGRTLQVLEHFLGRTGEIFVTKDGRMVAPNFWGRLFGLGAQSQCVQRFQIIYRRTDLICIRVVRREGFTGSIEEGIRDLLRKNFSPEVRFEFEYVSRIDPPPSGKFQVVINEVKRQSLPSVSSQIA
jgi:phenylacetate-CoA ligase